MTEPVLSRLARFVAQDPLDPPADTMSVLRDGVIDTLGCMTVGAGTDLARKSRAAVKAMGAEGRARIFGSNDQVSRPQAAFLNAVSGHSQDFDDWEIPGNTHPTVVLVPALLAIAEPECTGIDFARAYLAGFEVIARLGEGMNFEHYDAGWHSTATLGAIAAAAACARLLTLTETETAYAMSFACSSATGYTCQFGSNAKPVQAGFAARAGVEAACLAQAGLTAQKHVLDHPRGLAALMGGLDHAKLDRAMSKLGQPYALTEHGLVLKPWPSCGYTHRLMTCALSVFGTLDAKDITKVELHLPDFHAAILPFGQPKSRPEALFSAPFVSSMGLLRGQLTLENLYAETWNDPNIAELIAKTTVVPFAPKRPDLNYAPEDPDRLCITLNDGQTIEKTCVYPLGAPQLPMSTKDVMRKFQANVGTGSEAQARRQVWIQRVQNWPEHDDLPILFFEQGSSL